jgi:hypothetical protein
MTDDLVVRKFRKRPVVIEAIKIPTYAEVTPCPADLERALNDFMGADESSFTVWADGTATIRTLKGVMKASAGDWIIKGVKGEFYPCKADIFAATYEPAP